jgi:hypothetical protein
MKITRWIATGGLALGLGFLGGSPAFASTFRHGSVHASFQGSFRPAAPVISSAATPPPACLNFLLSAPTCPPPIIFVTFETP